MFIKAASFESAYYAIRLLSEKNLPLQLCDAGGNVSTEVFDFRRGAHIYVSDTIEINNHDIDWPASNVNFTNAEQVVQELNKWVEDQTGGMIKHFLDSISINGDLIPVTTAYLKALWAKPFQYQHTVEGDFKLEDGSVVQTMMMTQDGNFKTLRYKDIDTLELPYARSDVSMYILMPPLSSQAVLTMFNDLGMDMFQELIHTVHEAEERFCTIRIPKFAFESELDLKAVLESMGGGDLFNGPVNMTNLLETSDTVYLNQGVHKAQIEVNEGGTEASAASQMASSGYLSRENVFSVDRPFLFVIYHICTDTMLFAGVFNSPQ